MRKRMIYIMIIIAPRNIAPSSQLTAVKVHSETQSYAERIWAFAT